MEFNYSDSENSPNFQNNDYQTQNLNFQRTQSNLGFDPNSFSYPNHGSNQNFPPPNDYSMNHFQFSQSGAPPMETSFPTNIPRGIPNTYEVQNEDEVAVIEVAPAKENKIWSVKEDENLVVSYLQISTDPTIGKNQKNRVLWARVKHLYDLARRERPSELSERGIPSMRARWKRLSEFISKWVAAYRHAINNRRSGENDDDVLSSAQQIYKSETKHTFIYFHAWNIMKYYEKWSIYPQMNPHVEKEASKSSHSSKRSRVNEDGEYTIPSNPETPNAEFEREETPTHPPSRPPGVKASKRKGKGVASSSAHHSVDYSIHVQNMTQSRQAAIEKMTERLQIDAKRIEVDIEKNEVKKYQANMNILNTLLAKPSLTPGEEQLKEHLMKLMYN